MEDTTTAVASRSSQARSYHKIGSYGAMSQRTKMRLCSLRSILEAADGPGLSCLTRERALSTYSLVSIRLAVHAVRIVPCLDKVEHKPPCTGSSAGRLCNDRKHDHLCWLGCEWMLQILTHKDMLLSHQLELSYAAGSIAKGVAGPAQWSDRRRSEPSSIQSHGQTKCLGRTHSS